MTIGVRLLIGKMLLGVPVAREAGSASLRLTRSLRFIVADSGAFSLRPRERELS